VEYAGSIFHDLQRIFVTEGKQKILKVYSFCKKPRKMERKFYGFAFAVSILHLLIN